MAQFQITIPDAVIPRIRDAFGHEDLVTKQWVLATPAEVQAAIKGYLRSVVKQYEAMQALRLKETEVNNETW